MEMSVLGQGLMGSRRGAFLVLVVLCALPAVAPGDWSIRPMNYKGWNAQEIRNEWVTLTFVPKLGGRLMQVAFGQHEYLFVNRRYEAKYPASLAPDATLEVLEREETY